LDYFEKNPAKLIEATERLPMEVPKINQFGPSTRIVETTKYLDGFAKGGGQSANSILEDVALITSSNASKQTKIDKITSWLKEMGKSNGEINNIIKGKIDLSSSVSVVELQVGDKVFRFEREMGIIEPEKHFYTTADAADNGVNSVGFADPVGYNLVTYEVTSNTKVLKTKMNTGYIQYISGELQFNTKIISIEKAH
jgi:hypothetical protein